MPLKYSQMAYGVGYETSTAPLSVKSRYCSYCSAGTPVNAAIGSETPKVRCLLELSSNYKTAFFQSLAGCAPR